MECPSCGKEVLRPAEEVLSSLDSLYMSCPRCPPDPNLDKKAPFSSLPRTRVGAGGGGERCLCRCPSPSCGRAPLDLVILEALEILVDEGLRDPADNLRSVGWPLVEIGYALAYPPRLGEDDLLIVGEKLSRSAAERMVKIPEIKGVIEGGGVPGVTDSKAGAKPHSWRLLAGCDLRADVVQSLFGELLIYKSQSQVHVEFPRENAPKMRILEDLYFKGKLTDVADVLSGPGTLGLMAALAGAERVILNDIWRPAVENVMLNLEANRSILGIERIERLKSPPAGKVGSEPVLVGLAEGACRIEVYHGDAARLFSRAEPADLCLVDPFPGMKADRLIEACKVCGEIVVV